MAETSTMAPGSTIHLPTGQSVKVGGSAGKMGIATGNPGNVGGQGRMTPKWKPVDAPLKSPKK